MPSYFTIPQSSDIEDIEDVLTDIDGKICGPINKFLPKHFPDSEERCSESELQPEIPANEDFTKWFLGFFALEKSGSPRSEWHTSTQAILRPENTTGVHLFLSLVNDECDADADRQWGNVQVVGEFCPNDSVSYQHGFLNLCALARHVFARQPTRLFLHGFYIHQSMVELWVFDRSGAYSSAAFNIRDRSLLFIKVVGRYCSMSAEQLGRSNVVQSDKAGNYITLEETDKACPRKIYLAEQRVTNRRDLVGGGTTCYLARDLQSDQWAYAVKFKWRATRKEAEDVMLKIVNEKQVRNVVSLLHHREMETTADLRARLRFDLTRQFSGSRGGQTDTGPYGSQGIASHTQETRNRFRNRTLTCVVTTPVGRRLSTFKTAVELVQTLQDAVVAHRSLLQDAQVLHQDVSDGNILIRAVRRHQSESTGILIDFDTAIRLADQNDDMQSIAGTTLFMAIGVLRGTMHTYRHDLESFFYVLLRAIVASGEEGNNLPESSKLVAWTGKDYEENARVKSEHMAACNFRDILDEFRSGFQNLEPLAERLRGLLFPIRDGIIYTGTDKSPEAVDDLYDSFIEALGATLTDLGQVQSKEIAGSGHGGHRTSLQ